MVAGGDTTTAQDAPITSRLGLDDGEVREKVQQLEYLGSLLLAAGGDARRKWRPAGASRGAVSRC